MTQAEYDYYCEHFFDCEDNDDFHYWSDSEYWEREARLGAQWHKEDHGECSCGGSGIILTNIDTWISCGCIPDDFPTATLKDYLDDGFPTMTLEQYLNG
jgi:hypothetical protein